MTDPYMRDRFYVGGRWVPPAGSETIDVENPYTMRPAGRVPAASADDVGRAVAAARDAFPAWSATSPDERSAHLARWHDALAARSDDLVRAITAELGAPARVADRIHTRLPLQVLTDYVKLAGQPAEEETIGHSLVVHEPVGVVGAITPWNYPLHQVVVKLGASLAAGCTAVAKPSELTPLVSFLLFDAVHEAELPPGVVNLVTGTGPVAGEALATHPGVDMVSFTGSTATGTRVARLAADRVARVALELGGKSANIILPDADLDAAVKAGVASAFLNSGQTCTAWTRMLVHRDRYDEAVELAGATAARYALGPPDDPGTRLGPLVSGAHRERVLAYLRRGLEEGARIVTGGEAAAVPETGHFVAPTVLADVGADATVAQEEILGPVLAVMPFDDDDHAVAVANDSRYGLGGAVWSTDEDRALRVARRLRTGAVDINGAAFNPLAPFGGYKRSGYGRELGPYGLAEFQQVKAIQR